MLAILALLTAAWLGRAWILPRAAQWLNVGQPPQPCDYVLVLPGGEETRPFVAAALIKAGLARKALVPRVIPTPDTDDGVRRPAHDIIREVLVLRGVPLDDVILLGSDSASTHSDALALRQFLLARPGSTVAIVTHHYHTRRARWVFRKVLAERADDIRLVAAPVDEFNEETWWQSRAGAEVHLAEFAKLAFYAVRYGDPWVWGSGLVMAGSVTAFLVYRRRRLKPA